MKVGGRPPAIASARPLLPCGMVEAQPGGNWLVAGPLVGLAPRGKEGHAGRGHGAGRGVELALAPEPDLLVVPTRRQA